MAKLCQQTIAIGDGLGKTLDVVHNHNPASHRLPAQSTRAALLRPDLLPRRRFAPGAGLERFDQARWQCHPGADKRIAQTSPCHSAPMHLISVAAEGLQQLGLGSKRRLHVARQRHKLSVKRLMKEDSRLHHIILPQSNMHLKIYVQASAMSDNPQQLSDMATASIIVAPPAGSSDRATIDRSSRCRHS